MRRKIMRHLKDNVALTSVVVIVILGVLGYNLFLKNTAANEQVLVVHPADFLQQVSVSGKVVAAQDVDLGFSQSGRITYVRGDVGAHVSTGQLLAEIENADIRASISQKQAVLASQEAKLQSLQEGTRPEDIAVAQATVDGAASALDQADQGIINAVGDAYAKSDDAVHNKLDQFISNPRSSTPQLSFTTSASQLAIDIPAKRASVEQVLAGWQRVIAVLTPQSDLSAAAAQTQIDLAAVSALLSDVSAALARAVPSTSVNQATINTYTSDIATARTTINTSIAAINTALTAQKAAVSALDSARKSLALKKAGSTPADIAVQAAQVQAAQADIENAQAQLTKSRITAPFSGVITKMDAKVGQIVSPNVPEISIIGDNTLQIEAYVPEVEISSLAVGNAATTTFDAYGTGILFGAKVVAIDPAETVINGVSTYKTTMQFLKDDPRIKPGMTAEVLITVKEVPDALVVPQGVIFLKNSRQVVQVRRPDNTLVDVPVQTGGASSLGNVEIVVGLADGDVVVLNPDPNR
ncbi:efflux RND transporter periplasmic adaptor subunit [Candidatus Kaiserbacteria bacterium]|nr:efflux RND transporter periplasmic adaptor subunit [Candidatus Kaiserbacteria bacterium]